MTTKQGDVALLADPVAQRMLQTKTPARFAYNWSDGTPRVVPIGFHWNGAEIVLGTPVDAPKMKALHEDDQVALTIDSDTPPYKVLLIRGAVRTDVVDGIAPEYAATCQRVMGKLARRVGLRRCAPCARRWRASSSSRRGWASWTSKAASPARSNAPWNGCRAEDESFLVTMLR